MSASASAPGVTIEAPLDGAHAVAGLPVALRVSAVDPTKFSSPSTPTAAPIPDDHIRWMQGTSQIATGSVTSFVFDKPGTYPIDVVAEDGYCLSATKRVTLHVDSPVAASVAILSPVEGQEFLVGPPSFSQTISLVGAGSSTITEFNWTDASGFLGSGDKTLANIPLSSTSHNCVTEPHVITLQGKTSTGEVATSSVTIKLKTNCIK